MLLAAVSASLIFISLVQGLSWRTLLQMTSTNKAIVVVQSLSPVGLFWDPMDCSPSGSSVHGISQARILEWIATSSSRGSSQPRDQSHVSCLAGRCLPLFICQNPAHVPLRFLHFIQKKKQKQPLSLVNDIQAEEFRDNWSYVYHLLWNVSKNKMDWWMLRGMMDICMI